MAEYFIPDRPSNSWTFGSTLLDPGFHRWIRSRRINKMREKRKKRILYLHDLIHFQRTLFPFINNTGQCQFRTLPFLIFIVAYLFTLSILIWPPLCIISQHWISLDLSAGEYSRCAFSYLPLPVLEAYFFSHPVSRFWQYFNVPFLLYQLCITRYNFASVGLFERDIINLAPMTHSFSSTYTH